MSSRSYVLQKAIFVAAIAVASLIPFADKAMAQSGSTDATIIGRVIDEAQGVMPGVSVTASSPALQVGSLSTVTNGKGEYRLTGLSIGTYSIEYALSGFKTVRREGFRLTGGSTAKLDITLNVGGLEETITVSGEAPQVDVASTRTTTHLTKEALDTIPSGGAGYVGLLQMVPGARSTVVDVGGSSLNTNPGLADLGAVSQSWQTVDGVATKNPRSTESGNYFDFSSAEEAVVTTVGHDASVPNRGVNMNVVLPSGGNEFHGKIHYGGMKGSFESEQDSGGGGTVDLRDDLRAELSGRLVPDKLWFWASTRFQRSDSGVDDCFKPDGSACEELQHTRFFSGKLTWQPTASSRFSGFYMQNHGWAEETASSNRPWESRRSQVLTPDVGKVEWQYTSGSNFAMGVNLAGWRGFSGTICPGGPRNLDTEGVDFSGCEDAGQATVDTNGLISGYNERGGERLLESRYQLRTNISYFKPDWFYGSHEIKAGFDVFHAPQNRHNVGRGGALPVRLRFRNGVSDAVDVANNPVHPDLATRYYGFYVADSWRVGDRTTLNLGVRYAYDLGYENAGSRVAGDSIAASVYPAATFPKVTLPAYKTISPRIRAAYDLTGDGKTVIKGGWGRYQQMRSADHIQLVANNVVVSTTFDWNDLNNNRQFDVGESNLDLNGPDFITQTGVSGYAGVQGGVINPDETTPHTDEFMLSFERQLTQTLALRLTGVERRVGNAHRIEYIDRPASVYNIPYTNPDPGPDGRLGTADDTGQTITYYDYPSSLRGADFSSGRIINDSRANEKYSTLEGSLTKRMSSNWMFFASFSATKQDNPLPANTGTFNIAVPNSEINVADDTWIWLGRAMGSYRFPAGFLASVNFEHRNGSAYARTVAFRNSGTSVGTQTLNVESISSNRLPNINLLTLRLEKRISLSGTKQLTLRSNLYNATNTDVPTRARNASGSRYGAHDQRVLPRIFDLQATFGF